mgnify:CR=1 FL=1
MTYVEHAKFALGMCLQMFCSCLWFAIHGVIPYVQIPTAFNLEAMSEYLRGKDEERS